MPRAVTKADLVNWFDVAGLPVPLRATASKFRNAAMVIAQEAAGFREAKPHLMRLYKARNLILRQRVEQYISSLVDANIDAEDLQEVLRG